MSTLPEKMELTLIQENKGAAKKSISEKIKDWLIPLSTFITLLSIAVGGFISLCEYKSKLEVDTSLIKSQKVEVDIKLVKQFSELMALAQSRRGTHISEKAIERLLEDERFIQNESLTARKMNHILEEIASINIFTGSAEQYAAIVAATNLALEHDLLLEPAIAGLKEIKSSSGKDAKDLKNLITQCLGKLE